MGTVHQYLRAVVDTPEYQAAHPDVPVDSLDNFLSANMDEVRLHWADVYAGLVLNQRDLDDASHFRHGVLRRELQGDIGYERQRDHSAHTLNNYLLGWGLFAKSKKLKDAFQQQLHARGDDQAIPNDRLSRAFSIVWTWASLLHDVGYLLEGALAALSTETQDARVRRGVEVVRDFFDHRFWGEIELSAREDRIAALGTIKLPTFDDRSLGGVADSLRTLPTLEKLRVQIKHRLEAAGHRVPDCLKHVGELSGDAFRLWESHYEAYGQAGMAQRLRTVEGMFDRLVWRGYPGSNVRVLDHAVCSGLICLQYTTLYYLVLAELGPDVPDNARLKRVRKKLEDRRQYTTQFWWTLNVWGTAAAAIHNLVQSPPDWGDGELTTDKLTLSEDPIAYLGVLVDLLEEWDRYPVRRGATMGRSDELPLQGIDVRVDATAERVTFSFPERRAKKVIAELSKALDGWEALIEIKTH